MKRFIKVVVWIVVISAVVLTGIFLYWNREQEIDFAAILPDELEHCDRAIGQDNAEYIRLKGWFESNQKGWKNTPASYVPKHTYNSPNLSVNILVGGVVVNYETESGRWSQVVNRTEADDLSLECQKANN